jgi:hypothetical protein
MNKQLFTRSPLDQSVGKDLKPRLLLVELNEFDPEYLSRMAARLNLRFIQTALGYKHSKTNTHDLIEHHGLDPWVQWVGIHTGKPTVQHGIRRLGATAVQTSPQIWHAVAGLGYTWGAWGVMNAPLGSVEECRFFMPDPWSFDEVAFPKYLNDLLALPRYAARNYLDIDRKQALLATLRLARFFAPPGHWPLLFRFTLLATKSLLATGGNIHTFTTLLDYLSVLYFIRLRRKYRPNLSIIFLNHIAHLQHQFWTQSDHPHPELKLGLELCNAMLSLLLVDREPQESLVLMNGLKQKNVAGQGFHVYRQRNPQQAIEALGVSGGRVEQNMTHDATIIFEDAAECRKAARLLQECRLSDGHKTFFVEQQESNRVFYQLAFEHYVTSDTTITCGSYSQPFYDVFQLICERTGAHVPEGDMFCDGIDLPTELKNHEIYEEVLKHFAAHQLGRR